MLMYGNIPEVISLDASSFGSKSDHPTPAVGDNRGSGIAPQSGFAAFTSDAFTDTQPILGGGKTAEISKERVQGATVQSCLAAPVFLGQFF
jgi:hypothetical protein